MRMLDYRPNSVARALATGRSKTLGVVSFDTTLFGPASTLFGIERAAHQAGYFISIVSLLALDRASVLEAVERLRLQGVDGILVIAPQTDAAHTVLGAARTTSRSSPSRQGRTRASRSSRATASPAPRWRLSTSSTWAIARVWHIAGPHRLVGGAAARRRLARRRSRRPARRCHPAAGRRLEREVGL